MGLLRAESGTNTWGKTEKVFYIYVLRHFFGQRNEEKTFAHLAVFDICSLSLSLFGNIVVAANERTNERGQILKGNIIFEC